MYMYIFVPLANVEYIALLVYIIYTSKKGCLLTLNSLGKPFELHIFILLVVKIPKLPQNI